MRAIFILLLCIPLLGKAQENNSVNVLSVDDVNVFVMHMPIGEYTNLGTVNLVNNEGGIGERINELVALAKEKYGDDLTAIYTRGGQVAQCIGENNSNSAKEITVGTHPIFLFSRPNGDYSIVTQQELEVYNGKNISQGNQEIEKLISTYEESNRDIDAVYSLNGTTFVFIRFE